MIPTQGLDDLIQEIHELVSHPCCYQMHIIIPCLQKPYLVYSWTTMRRTIELYADGRCDFETLERKLSMLKMSRRPIYDRTTKQLLVTAVGGRLKRKRWWDIERERVMRGKWWEE